MICTTEIYKVRKNNGKWVRGEIRLSKTVQRKLGDEDKVVTVMLFEDDEIPDIDEIKIKLKELEAVKELQNKIMNMRDEL